MGALVGVEEEGELLVVLAEGGGGSEGLGAEDAVPVG